MPNGDICHHSALEDMLFVMGLYPNHVFLYGDICHHIKNMVRIKQIK